MEKAKEKKAEQIFKRVLAEIKPSKIEASATTANVNILTHRLKKIVPKNVEIMVVGSIARGTNLKGDADIDLFMLFDSSLAKEKLARLGLEYGKRLVDKKKGEHFEIKYAEHPYVRVFFSNGIRADIVPARKIKDASNLATAVDRSPLHANFVNENLSEKQRDEVRLLKYLLKAHSIYGAEIKTGGFSGYLCELLIHQYGSLTKLLENIARLRPPVTLDPKTKTSFVDEKIAKKFNSSFVVIDPVDPDRNVAAAVTEESLARFALLSRRFISGPTIDLFYGYGYSSIKTRSMLDSFIKGSGINLFLMVLNVPDKSADVLWPQLRKAMGLFTDYLKKYGYAPYLEIPWVEGRKGFILMGLPRSKIETRLMKGPDVFKAPNPDLFLEKHKDSFGFVLQGSNLYTIESNKYPEAAEIMREIAKGRIIKLQKDVTLKGAKLFVNKIPKEYSESTYVELRKVISL